jgi:hypothetical protein
MVMKETLFVTQMEEDAVEGEILAHASLISKSTRSRPPLTPIGIPLQAKSATSDPDTMYYHQAMKQPDREKFIQAARDEFDSLLRQGVMSNSAVKYKPNTTSLPFKRPLVYYLFAVYIIIAGAVLITKANNHHGKYRRRC